MKCVSLQVALFWREKLERPDLFANRINARFNNLFDAMPQIINVPLEVPVDVPVVQMSCSTKGVQLNVARSRCDLLITANLMSQNSFGGTIQSFQDLVMKYIENVYEERISISRMGIIAVAFDKNENAVSELMRKYWGIESAKVREVNMRINTEGKISGFVLNNIIEASVGNLVNEDLGLNENGIVYQRDINNVETNGTFSIKNAKELWKFALNYYTEKKMGEI